MALVIGVEVVGAVFFPFPPGVDPNDIEVCRAHVARCPQWLLVVAIAGWVAAVFASCWVATRLGAGRHPAFGIAIGALFIAAAAFNMYLLPYPLWFEAGNYLLLPLSMLAAVMLARRKK